MRLIAITGVLLAGLAAAAGNASAQAPEQLGTVTAGSSATFTLPVIDPPGASTSSSELVTYRRSACGGPWTVALFQASDLVETEFLSGGRVRVTIRADAQVGTRKTAYRLYGTLTVTRIDRSSGSPVTTTSTEACWTGLQEAEYTVRAPSRPSAVPASEAHLSSTPYRSQPVSRPSCYVVVTSHARSGKACQNCPYQRTSDSVSMTACMTPRDLYQSGFVNAVPDPTVPGAIDSAISDYVNGRQCRPDENRPDSPAQSGESNSCLQSEGWTHHE